MTWRLEIRHRTAYRYQREVETSYNEARITPLTTDRQTVLDASVDVSTPSSALRYWDYWGTLVHAFDIHVPHTQLVVTSAAVVETSGPPPCSDSVGWDDLALPDVAGRFAELLAPTRCVPFDDELREAGHCLANDNTPIEACQAALEWVRARLRYKHGTTTVSTSADEALRQGSGVCQDFAHVMLALLRAMDVPARYISGYLHPSADAEVGVTAAGQSHAWVEAWTGEWVPFDPTNGGPVGERHVIVGRARDYADVTPLKGIYHGGPLESLDVTVELTRLV